MQIHELNTLVEKPGSTDFIPIDTGFDTAKISAEKLLEPKLNRPIDEHNQYDNGTAGQLLRTKGDGSTEWSDVGNPTDAQTAQAVSDWLDAHPEATTTVADGSLTDAKFSSALKLQTIKDYVTPEMYGAVGDGTTDDTTAIQTAMDSGKTVILGSKTYKIATLEISSNTILLGLNGATLDSSGTAFKANSGITYLHDVILQGITINADTGIDFTGRNYDNYAFKVVDVIFNCVSYCINATKCFEWYICNVQLSGNYGFVGIQGPSNTFINIYETNCIYMFVNCNGLFIDINTSNSGNTQVVFDYTNAIYGNSLKVIGSNFEDVAGKIVRNKSTNGFSNLIMIGFRVADFNTSDYLFEIANVQNLFLEVGQVENEAILTKFINVIGGIANVFKSFYVNRNFPFAINGYVCEAPYQEMIYPANSYYPQTKFSGIQSRIVKGCVVPIQEDIALAYTLRISTGSLVNLTPGSGQDLAAVRPFYSAQSGVQYFDPGTIITIKNSTGINLNLGSVTQDYTFASSGTMANGTTKSFILQHNGTRLVWKEI